MKPSTKGFIFVLLSAVMFGSYGVWSRLIGDDFGNFYQGWTRGLIITLALLPILILGKKIKPIARKDWRWFSVFLLFTSATQAPLFYAFNNMDIGVATLLFFVGMLLTMYAFGFIFFNEKATKDKVLALLLACVGLYLVFEMSLEVFALLAACMAVINGIASGGEISSSKKLTGDYSPLYVSWLAWVAILFTNAPISFFLGETQHVFSFSDAWFWQMLYSLASLLGFYLVIKGFKYVEASIGGIIGLLEVVFGIMFGILIFNEQLTVRLAIGALLIMLAAALPHITELRQKLNT